MLLRFNTLNLISSTTIVDNQYQQAFFFYCKLIEQYIKIVLVLSQHLFNHQIIQLNNMCDALCWA